MRIAKRPQHRQVLFRLSKKCLAYLLAGLTVGALVLNFGILYNLNQLWSKRDANVEPDVVRDFLEAGGRLNFTETVVSDWAGATTTAGGDEGADSYRPPAGTGTIDVNDSFSACLLLADDNHRLPEWLAYHYYVMPLTYLYVGVDPNSRTSPRDILKRWGGKMKIVEWTSSDERLIRKPKLDKASEYVTKYRLLQLDFYTECTRHMMDKRKGWTAYFDIDEYFTLNADVMPSMKRPLKWFTQPGSILRVCKGLASRRSKPKNKDGLRGIPRRWYDRFQSTPCVTLPRRLINAEEMSEEEKARDASNHNIPSFIETNDFDTLRYKYHGMDQTGKSIVDLSRLPPQNFTYAWSSHTPIKDVCPLRFYIATLPNNIKMPVRLHHYLGSWESYSCRKDARDSSDAAINDRWRKSFLHNYDEWKDKAKLRIDADNDESEKNSGKKVDLVRLWINGFVDLVGEKAAISLLKGAGDLSHCITSNSPPT